MLGFMTVYFKFQGCLSSAFQHRLVFMTQSRFLFLLKTCLCLMKRHKVRRFAAMTENKTYLNSMDNLLWVSSYFDYSLVMYKKDKKVLILNLFTLQKVTIFCNGVFYICLNWLRNDGLDNMMLRALDEIKKFFLFFNGNKNLLLLLKLSEHNTM